VQNETNKTLNLMARAEEAAKELGMNPNNVKGLRELEKLLDEIKKRAELIERIKQDSKVFGDRAI
jgi:hypothetical protein